MPDRDTVTRHEI